MIDKLIQFIELYSEIDKIFEIEGNEFNIIIKLFNSNEKHRLNFILFRIFSQLKPVKINSLDLLKLIKQKEKIDGEIGNNQKKLEINKNIIPEEIDLNLNNSIISCYTNDCSNVNSLLSPFETNQKKKKFVSKTSTNANSISNKENYSISSNLSCENNKVYTIIYDKKYSGIKKRNTPDEERKKYIINIKDIINEKDTRTTLMIKNIPNFITQSDLLEIINRNFATCYNFFYLPIDFNRNQNAGYAFINFKVAKFIVKFYLEYENKPWEFSGCQNKVCYLSYARIQGFRSITEHFNKSNIMKQVDEKVKPIIIR
jgi:hypothetical protein